MSDAGLLTAVRELGLLTPEEGAELSPLTGGVSADVFGVRAESGRQLVVKRSIPRLRVEADWRAPVERDAIEADWLETVGAIDQRLLRLVRGADGVETADLGTLTLGGTALGTLGLTAGSSTTPRDTMVVVIGGSGGVAVGDKLTINNTVITVAGAGAPSDVVAAIRVSRRCGVSRPAKKPVASV